MNTMIFKTNAKCEGCLAKIEEILQGKISREEWNLDLSDSNRPLTVASVRLSISCQKSIPETSNLPLPTFTSNNKASGRFVNQSSITRTIGCKFLSILATSMAPEWLMASHH